jgi:acyl carrier protein
MRMPRPLALAAGRALNGVHTRLALSGATSVGAGVRVFGWPQISCDGEFVVGDGVVFVSSPAPIEIVVPRGGRLAIGDGSLIEGGAILRARHRVTIGIHARIGVGCIVDDDGRLPEEIIVRDRAWIEDGAVLLGGARVAAGVTVSKGSVVGGSGAAPASARTANDDHAARVIEQRVRAVIVRVVPSASLVEKGADLRACKGWDSLAALRALVALEKEFAVTLPHDLFSQEPRLDSAIPLILAATARPEEAA